jgi:hypothetical protein
LVAERQAPSIEERWAPSIEERWAPSIEERWAPSIEERRLGQTSRGTNTVVKRRGLLA